jgi:hypothetical protein
MVSSYEQKIDVRHGWILDLLVKLDREMKETTSLLTRITASPEMMEDVTTSSGTTSLNLFGAASSFASSTPSLFSGGSLGFGFRMPASDSTEFVGCAWDLDKDTATKVVSMQTVPGIIRVGDEHPMPEAREEDCLEHTGSVPIVVPFRAEHTLALVRKVFDGLHDTSNCIIVEHGMFLGTTTSIKGSFTLSRSSADVNSDYFTLFNGYTRLILDHGEVLSPTVDALMRTHDLCLRTLHWPKDFTYEFDAVHVPSFCHSA